MRGFGWVMLYGAAGVWLLGALSFAISGDGSRRLATKSAERAAQSAAGCDSC
jgi:hypothetical protein